MKPRPIKITGDVAIIPLTRGYEAIIDVADVPLVDGYNWYADIFSNHIYATRRDVGGGTKNVRLHRHIMMPEEWLVVDHINGNGLDNRRKNMRVCTRAQNTRNQKVRSDNTSGVKGVSWYTNEKKWSAEIWFCRKKYRLGLYSNIEDAHAAYCEASARLHGAFGRVE